MRSAIVALAALAALGSPALAQPGGGTAALLQGADEDLRAGRCTPAAAAAAAVARQPGVMARADRAEAWRLLGLAQLCAGDAVAAETAFLELLTLDPDARLDPDLVPPDDIAFFERVRLENRELIERNRPAAPRSRVAVFNLLPPLGQFQNGHRTKAWILAGTGAALLAVNVTSFALLESWCGDDGLCVNGDGDSRTRQARTWRTVNTVTGVALIGAVLYGVADGFYYHYAQKREERAAEERRQFAIGVTPGRGGAVLTVGGTF